MNSENIQFVDTALIMLIRERVVCEIDLVKNVILPILAADLLLSGLKKSG